MDTALVIGGTRFVGRHAVAELLAHDYRVTLFNRGSHSNPFADRPDVTHVAGDRTDDDAVREAVSEVAPDLLVDCVAYHPDEVRVAIDAARAAGVESYVYVSSISAYEPEIPLREDGTPLYPCDDEQAVDDSVATYGARKAEGDRVVAAAAGDGDGPRTTSVRPGLVYGPHDYTERTDYWIDQVATRDRVLVPGDGDSLLHRAYVEDVASTIRIVGERGAAGEAYNVGDRRLVTLEGALRRFADALGTEVVPVHASARELAAVGRSDGTVRDADDDGAVDAGTAGDAVADGDRGDGEPELAPGDFPLYTPEPYVADTTKLAGLGWDSTPLDTAYRRTVADHRESDRDGADLGPDPRLVDAFLDGV